MRRGKSLVMALLAVGSLAGCAEEEKPIDVPEQLRQGVLDVLHAVDKDAKAEFSGETCNTDRLADPPDDHRWRLDARFDGTPEALRAAGTKQGWQPERAEDGTLVLVNHHRFGEPVDIVVRDDGTVRMVVEKDCSTTERTELNLPLAVEVPELTSRQADRLDAMLDEVDETLAAIYRALEVRPEKDVHIEEKERRRYLSCSAGERSGARWLLHDVVYAEATRYDDLGQTADALVGAADGWETTKREEYVDTKGDPGVDLELRSNDGSTTMTVDIDFWHPSEVDNGVQLHVTSGQTECVAVDAA